MNVDGGNHTTNFDMETRFGLVEMEGRMHVSREHTKRVVQSSPVMKLGIPPIFVHH